MKNNNDLNSHYFEDHKLLDLIEKDAKNQLDVISFDYLQGELIDRGLIKSNIQISKEIKHTTQFADLELYDHSFFDYKDTI